MRFHHEKPDTRVDRYICLALLVPPVLVADYLWLLITRGPNMPHPYEFLGLALVSGFLLYLLVTLLSLFTVHYQLAEDHLILRQGLFKAVIPLDEATQLYRWRYRWGWSDGARQDLGVEEIRLFPPVWFWRESPIWVLSYLTPKGERRAAAFHPSAELLNLIRERTREAPRAAS